MVPVRVRDEELGDAGGADLRPLDLHLRVGLDWIVNLYLYMNIYEDTRTHMHACGSLLPRYPTHTNDDHVLPPSVIFFISEERTDGRMDGRTCEPSPQSNIHVAPACRKATHETELW